ncbi:CheR family methyltransferase [Deinococcus roseus]|uniref:Protein-glutamate O-methyltransferase n=1 Tax=Deinococcus roseus TaxID=392414 RepID=A0ABQ2D0N6_9DEIO|nr:CheR family methyltransferase [Deinococcus roseus]GGJ39217.1 protein-glutamate O-methyltransferase [Deinococcus roseus]
MSALSRLRPDLLHALIGRIEQVSGIRIQQSQQFTLERALSKRPQSDPNEATTALLALAEERFVREFVHELTIHETYFFRGDSQMQQLRTLILPELKTRPYPARLWSAGCSTGEEAYTLSMLLKTEFDMHNAVVLGTDLHPEVVARARHGRYREWSFRATSQAVREHCFSHVGDSWSIKTFLRQHVHFGVLNLKSFPWLPDFQNPAIGLRQLDVIVCRNVTLYFGSESAQQVYQQFARLLAPAGVVMLGPTDPQPLPVSGLFPHRHPLGWLWKTTPDVSARKDLNKDSNKNSNRNQQAGRGLTLNPHLNPQKPIAAQKKPAVPRNLQPAPTPAQQKPSESEPPVAQPTPTLQAADFRSLPDHLEGLRQHVFLHPNDVLALYQLAQIWLRQGETERARPLLRRIRNLLTERPPADHITPELTAQELLTAALYTLSQMKGKP